MPERLVSFKDLKSWCTHIKLILLNIHNKLYVSDKKKTTYVGLWHIQRTKQNDLILSTTDLRSWQTITYLHRVITEKQLTSQSVFTNQTDIPWPTNILGRVHLHFHVRGCQNVTQQRLSLWGLSSIWRSDHTTSVVASFSVASLLWWRIHRIPVWYQPYELPL